MTTSTHDPAAPVKARRETRNGFRAGWRIVASKELADHMRSARLLMLLILVSLAGLVSVHAASGPIREAASAASRTPSVFLMLFTIGPNRVPSFIEFIGILGPLLGIVFGFDAINSERSQRTLPKLVAQPIHRDDIVNGKFVAGIGAIAVVLTAVTAVVAGYGMIRLGVSPTGAELARLAAFLVLSIVYVSLWLGFALLLSIATRHAATAALAALAAWLVLTLFMGLIAGLAADAVHPVDSSSSIEEVLSNARFELNVSRISPDQLYQEATKLVLTPTQQQTGISLNRADLLAVPTALDLRESLSLAWWQLSALLAACTVMFASSYALFLRQEVRA